MYKLYQCSVFVCFYYAFNVRHIQGQGAAKKHVVFITNIKMKVYTIFECYTSLCKV